MGESHVFTSALLNSAHVQYLEQLNNQEFWDYVKRLATTPPSPSLQAEEYLECQLEQGRCILPLSSLREVIPPPHHITLFPASPQWMPGITSWRGNAIAVIDLDAYLSGRPARAQTNHMLLIAEEADITIGLLGTVLGPLTSSVVEEIISSSLSPAHNSSEKAASELYGDCLLLNMQKLLADIVHSIQATAAL